MNERLIFDTGFLFACFDIRDDYHIDCKQLMSRVLAQSLLPDVVLPELSYLILKRLDVKTLVSFLQSVANGDFALERTTAGDLERAAEILEQYNDNNIDLVDAVIVAMAERLDITRILTVDRRHFGVFRPVHCAAFEIVP